MKATVRPQPQSLARARREWLLLGSLLVAVGLWAGWSRYTEHRAVEAEQRQLLAAQALAIDDSLSRQLTSVATALRNVREGLAAAPAEDPGPTLSRELGALGDAIPGVASMLVIDRGGRVLASSRPESIGRDVGGQDYFQQGLARPDAAQPTLASPSAAPHEVEAMTLSLIVPSAAHGVGGMVAASLDSNYLRRLLRATLYTRDVRVDIAQDSGLVLLQEPAQKPLAGLNLDQPGSSFRRHREGGEAASVMTGIDPASGERRVTAQRTVRPAGLAADPSIVIAVSRSLDAVFEPWRRQTAAYGALYALFVLATGLGLVSRQRRQQAIGRLEEQREAAERQTAERLELALRGADLGLWDLDVRSGVSTVSERWNTMLGLPHQAVYPDLSGWRSRVHPDDWDQVWAEHRAHLEGRTERFEAVYRMRHADGHWVWILDRAQVLERDAQGAPLRMIGTHMDTTESMQRKLALRANEQRLRALLDNLGSGVVVHGPDTEVLDANPAACRIIGLTLEQMRGKVALDPHWAFLREDGSPMPLHGFPVPQVIASGAPVNKLVLGLQRPELERPLWVLVDAYPLRDAQGRIEQIVVTFSDITVRKQAEESLQRLNRALRVLSSCSTTLVNIRDEPAYLAEVCRSVVVAGGYRMAWIGYAENDAGKTVRVVAEAGDDRGYLDDVRISWDEARDTGRGPTGTAIRSGSTQINQNWRTHPQAGPWREAALQRGYQSSIALPLIAQGRCFGALAVYAAEPDAFNPQEVAPLEELARNVALGLESLRASRQRDIAEGASRAKSAFLANMSHEIRTPLNAIIGLNYLMRQEGVTPEQSARLDKIDSAGQHLLSIVDDILDLSKIEAGRMQLESTNFHLSAILDNVQSIIAESARAKGLTVSTDGDAVPTWLRGDPTRLRQALLNFAGNAVKFTERGSIRLHAKLLDDRAGELLVRFSVEDTGIGLDARQIPRLFEAFEQADASTTRRFGGTGLGLAIAQRLARLMGGECGAESELGVGSTFWFTARLQHGHGLMPAPAAERSTSAQTQLREGFRGARVLLAEDNEVNLEVALAMLHGVGLNVDAALNGREAVEKATRRVYDLVLMDMQMPEMGGLEATRAIRQLEGWHSRPILALTANAFDEDRSACEAAGMNDFIAKPMDANALYGVVLHWLAAAEASASGSIAQSAPSVG